MQYISYILFFLFAVSNGITEVLSFWYKQSIFQDLDPRKYNPNVNWKYIKPFLNWMRLDLYHIVKTIGVMCGIMSIVIAFITGHPLGITQIIIKLVILWGCWFSGAELIFKTFKRPFKETPNQFI